MLCCIATIFSPGLGHVPLDDVIPGILTSQSDVSVDSALYNALQTTTNAFADENVKFALKLPTLAAKVLEKPVPKILKSLAPKLAAKAAKMIPVIGAIMDIAVGFAEILETETDWKAQFAEVAKKEIEKSRADTYIDQMDTILSNVKDFMKILKNEIAERETEKRAKREVSDQDEAGSDENGKGRKGKKKLLRPQEMNIAGKIHGDLNELIITFLKPKSIFKHFPLIGAPFLLELSMIVAAFEKIAIDVGLRQAKTIPLSCRVLNALIDYRPFVVADRLEKLNVPLDRMMSVRNQPFNPNGYNESNLLKCGETCSNSGSCLHDDFSNKQYQNTGVECEFGYMKRLRYLVEQMFPIELLTRRCDHLGGLGEPTGNSLNSRIHAQ